MTWHAARLGDVLTLKRGYDLPKGRRVNGDVPVVSSSGVTGYHNERKVSAPGVVTGRYGTLGEVYYVDRDFWPLNTALYVKDFKGNDPRFLSYFLKSTLRGTQSDKAAVPGVNRNDLHERLVRIPKDVAAQRRIAEVLALYDDLIENNRCRVALLEEAARLLYREWFVRLRFPGHEHTRIEGGVPSGWEMRRLGTIADVNRETLKKSFDGDIEYIDISAVTPGQINQTTRYAFRNAPSRARRVVRHGDVIWSCVRPNRRSHAVIWNPAANLIASTGFAVLTPTAVPTSFLLQATTTDVFVGYLNNNARGAAYPAVLAADFERAEVLVPPPRLLGSFNDLAEPVLAQCRVLRVLDARLGAARDVLLPRLMSGEIAV